MNNGILPLSAFGGGLGQFVDLPADNLVGSWTRSISPTVYNEFRFGVTLYPTQFDILSRGENLNQKFGIKNVPGDTFNDGLDHGLARSTWWVPLPNGSGGQPRAAPANLSNSERTVPAPFAGCTPG